MAVLQVGMFDGLAQGFFLGLLQGGFRLLVEARRIFPVRSQQLCKKRLRHLVMLIVGLIGIFGDGARGHVIGEGGVALGIAAGQSRSGARAQPLDRGTDHDVGQRHAFGGADNRGNETHEIAAFCGGNGKNMLVRVW